MGPNDLAGSVGHIGRVLHPDMLPIYDRIGKIMRKYNKVFGVSGGFNPEFLQSWIDRGAKIIFCGNDVGYVYEGAVSVLGGLTELTKS